MNSSGQFNSGKEENMEFPSKGKLFRLLRSHTPTTHKTRISLRNTGALNGSSEMATAGTGTKERIVVVLGYCSGMNVMHCKDT